MKTCDIIEKKLSQWHEKSSKLNDSFRSETCTCTL